MSYFDPFDTNRGLLEALKETNVDREKRRTSGQTAALVPAGGGVTERREARNGFLLGVGERQGFTVEKSDTIIEAVPGTVITSQIVVEGTCIIKGAHLICEGNEPAVVVKSTGRLIIGGCHVIKEADQAAAADCYIQIEAGGYASINGSVFHEAQSAGVVVHYADPVTQNQIAVTGCVNLTGQLHTNVGFIQEVP